MTTTAPAEIINRAPKIGTLQIGAPADVAIMELVEGPVSFVDTRNNQRDGKVYLKPVQTVINGVPFGRPYQVAVLGAGEDLGARHPRPRSRMSRTARAAAAMSAAAAIRDATRKSAETVRKESQPASALPSDRC